MEEKYWCWRFVQYSTKKHVNKGYFEPFRSGDSATTCSSFKLLRSYHPPKCQIIIWVSQDTYSGYYIPTQRAELCSSDESPKNISNSAEFFLPPTQTTRGNGRHFRMGCTVKMIANIFIYRNQNGHCYYRKEKRGRGGITKHNKKRPVLLGTRNTATDTVVQYVFCLSYLLIRNEFLPTHTRGQPTHIFGITQLQYILAKSQVVQ